MSAQHVAYGSPPVGRATCDGRRAKTCAVLRPVSCLFCLVSWILCPAAGLAAGTTQIRGYVAGEGRYFYHYPSFADQERSNASVAAQPEYYHRWDNDSSLTFVPFGRVDSTDPERTHIDIRELNYDYIHPEFELRVGIGKVFWGATEFVHLVDVVNQTDWVEHIDGEDKLGQPMFEFAKAGAWGKIDVFILPYFRERTFPGLKGRLRPGITIDRDNPIFESPDKNNRWDFVARYSRTLGPCDFGIYIFNGTDRDPLLYPTTNDQGQPVLRPFYQEIEQIGLDLQWPTGNWIWKLEAIYRHGYFDGYFAATGGAEYTLVNVAETGTDLGLVLEYAFDDRGRLATTPYNNDAMVGLRISPKDAASTQILLGWIQNMDDSSKVAVVEASRRLGSHWKVSLDVWNFMGLAPGNLYYSLRADDFARLELAYYF